MSEPFNVWEWWAKELADALDGVMNQPNPPIPGMDCPWSPYRDQSEEQADREARWDFATRTLAEWNEKLPALGGVLAAAPERPEIVVLCGSTRFFDAFMEANYRLTMAGKIVLSVGFYPHATAESGHGEGVGHDSAEKVALDELHKRKIDLADSVYVLNVGGYIGESTRSEIDYALAIGRPIAYLVPAAAPGVIRGEDELGEWEFVPDTPSAPDPAVTHYTHQVAPGIWLTFAVRGDHSEPGEYEAIQLNPDEETP